MTLQQARAKQEETGNYFSIDNEEIYDQIFVRGNVFAIGLIRYKSKNKGKAVKNVGFTILVGDDGHYWPIGTSNYHTVSSPCNISLHWATELRELLLEAQEYALLKRWKQ